MGQPLVTSCTATGGAPSASISSGQMAGQSSGRKSLRVTAPAVSRSMATHDAGSMRFPRDFQLLTAAWVTPMADASFPTPPQCSMALSRGFIPPFNHGRDTCVNTIVIRGSKTICQVDTIASRLKHARDLKDWTQGQLAKNAGVTQGTVGNIEAGLRKSLQSLPRLADALGVRHVWLRDGDGDMLPELSSDPEFLRLLRVEIEKRSITQGTKDAVLTLLRACPDRPLGELPPGSAARTGTNG